mmetsp:Transcript_58929/g.135164  ORF Transcript_58929/g.135164 Transcript_58929/m.135164 type:complete len:209 (+) Transcript_58929:332-958(+)
MRLWHHGGAGESEVCPVNRWSEGRTRCIAYLKSSSTSLRNTPAATGPPLSAGLSSSARNRSCTGLSAAVLHNCSRSEPEYPSVSLASCMMSISAAIGSSCSKHLKTDWREDTVGQSIFRASGSRRSTAGSTMFGRFVAAMTTTEEAPEEQRPSHSVSTWARSTAVASCSPPSAFFAHGKRQSISSMKMMPATPHCLLNHACSFDCCKS